MIKPTTFSIVAFDPTEACWGIAVASKFPAVGSVVPWARSGAGAIATQSFANTSFGPDGLDHLAKGFNAEQTFQLLKLNDPMIEQRQVGIVDAHGGSFSFTGKECYEWAGGVCGNGYAIQGNMLANSDVVPAMESAYLGTTGGFAQRLFAALLAGDNAGGDKRGKQSSAIFVVKANAGYGGYNDRMLDYRVDDDPDPVVKLKRLIELHSLYFDKSDEANQLQIIGETKQILESVLKHAGYLPTTYSTEEFHEALARFIGNENFEDRCNLVTNTIDKPVLEYLQRRK